MTDSAGRSKSVSSTSFLQHFFFPSIFSLSSPYPPLFFLLFFISSTRTSLPPTLGPLRYLGPIEKGGCLKWTLKNPIFFSCFILYIQSHILNLIFLWICDIFHTTMPFWRFLKKTSFWNYWQNRELFSHFWEKIKQGSMKKRVKNIYIYENRLFLTCFFNQIV